MNATDKAWADLVSAHYGAIAARRRMRALEAPGAVEPRSFLPSGKRKAIGRAEAKLHLMKGQSATALGKVLASNAETALDVARQIYAGNPSTQPPDAVCDALASLRRVFRKGGPITFGYVHANPRQEKHLQYMLDFGICAESIYLEQNKPRSEFNCLQRALRRGDTLVICDSSAIGRVKDARRTALDKTHAKGVTVIIWKPEGATPIEIIEPPMHELLIAG